MRGFWMRKILDCSWRKNIKWVCNTVIKQGRCKMGKEVKNGGMRGPKGGIIIEEQEKTTEEWRGEALSINSLKELL